MKGLWEDLVAKIMENSWFELPDNQREKFWEATV